MKFGYLRQKLEAAKRYLPNAEQGRKDGYLISLLIDACSLKRFFPENRKVNNFTEGVEALVSEFSSRERLVELSS